MRDKGISTPETDPYKATGEWRKHCHESESKIIRVFCSHLLRLYRVLSPVTTEVPTDLFPSFPGAPS